MIALKIIKRWIDHKPIVYILLMKSGPGYQINWKQKSKYLEKIFNVELKLSEYPAFSAGC